MFCTKCGVKNEDNAKFCFSCGNPLSTEVGNQTISEPTVTQGNSESTYWENPSLVSPVQQVRGQAEQFQNPGQPVPSQYNYQPGANGSETPKIKNTKPFILAIPIIAIIAIIAIVGIIASQSNKGVLDNILSAVQGTLNADSFEFEAEAYMKDEDYTDGGKVDGIIEYDLDKEKLSFDIRMGEERTILYDEVIYDLESGEIWDDTDVSFELGLFYDYYKDYKDDLDNLSDIDWEAAAKEAGIPLNFDTEVLQKCIKEFEKNMNDTKYIKSVCNEYEKRKTKEGTKYSFDVDVSQFVESLVETFQPVFDELNISKSQLAYLYDELDTVEECKIDIIVKSGKLVGLGATITVNDYSEQTFELELKIDNYGKASLDVDEIEGYLEDYDSSEWDTETID